MKQNDLEYIKDRMNRSGVNAPDALGEQEMLRRLQGVTPVQEVKKPKKKWVAPVSAAAALALITATAFGLNGFLGNLSLSRQRHALGLDAIEDYDGLRAFSSRSELTDAVKRVQRLNTSEAFDRNTSDGFFTDIFDGGKSYDVAEDDFAYEAAGGSSAGNALTGASDFGGTYLQYGDVDEADTVKTDGRYIYYLDRYDESEGYTKSCIKIFSANPDKPEQVADLVLGRGDMMTADEFYLYDGKLVVIEDAYVSNSLYYTSNTHVVIYDVSNVGSITEIGSYQQSGDYVSSRMIGGALYVVSNQEINEENEVPTAQLQDNAPSATEDEATVRELDPGCIYAPSRPTQNSFLVIGRIDVDSSLQATETKAILGAAGTVYCNGSNLYVLATSYNPEVYELLLNEQNGSVPERYINRIKNGYYSFYDYTRITKISLDETMEFVADGMVNGEVLNQYALDEKDGNLRVATTSYNDKGTQVNNLFVLDGQLNELGSVTGFAADESIKAVRYVGDTAYVITYEQTDPLFVIDTADPRSPKLLGEVKISGFSSMLVPVDENTLLGIGYHTVDEPDDYTDMEIQEGLKLVLFDVSDKANPRVLDAKVFEDYSSEVQYNPKALLVNPQRGEYTLPYAYYHWEESDVFTDGDEYASSGWYSEQKSGVISFAVENGKIVIRNEYEAKAFNSGQLEGEVERCVYAGNTIYLLGEANDRDDYSKSMTLIDAVPYR